MRELDSLVGKEEVVRKYVAAADLGHPSHDLQQGIQEIVA
jgi:hypothetical protein